MRANTVPEHILSGASARIAEWIGLDFRPERWGDLERGLTRVAAELNFKDAAACAQWLMSATPTKEHLKVFASQLTTGETYFLREPKTFAVLASSVLPELIRTRRGGERRLRVWSAGCCTGEEPYSLAIFLSQVIPDFEEWHITILATDLNEQFLCKAAAGVFGEWSFREAPAGFKERYFQRTGEGRYQILPEIKRRVKFAQLNLVEDIFPSLETDTNAMDIVFCRNVLMYLTPAQMRKVVGRLHRVLIDGGWLAVSPSEVSQALFSEFEMVSYSDVILYRKNHIHARSEQPGVKASGLPEAFATPPAETPNAEPAASPIFRTEEIVARPSSRTEHALNLAKQFYEEGRFAEASESLLLTSPPPESVEEYELLARALANQGALQEAMDWCDRWLEVDRLDATGHYLRAVVLQELGRRDEARQALQRAIYLQPELVLAHFALGNLARAAGLAAEANRHFTNALSLLRRCPADEPLPESDGLTAGRLEEIINSLLAMEAAA
jgi:chemotaxis protein methyltransferase CheR